MYGNTYNICKCKKCNAYFLGPPPDKVVLDKAYDSSYYGEKEEKFYSILEKVLDYFRWKRAKRVSFYLNNGAKILDIGCGNGRFLNALLKFGKFELYGTEMKGNSANRAMRIPEINLKIGALSETDYASEFFDTITMFHVFEHLTEPKNTLEIIEKIIKKRGIFIISFPNIDSLQSNLFKGKWLHLDPPRHLFFFAPNDFISLLEKYGFKLLKQRYVSAEHNPYGMVQSILNLLYNKREILYEFFKRNSTYLKDVSKVSLFFQLVFFLLTFPLFTITDILLALFKKGATVEFIFQKGN
jgi:SAM-dependent methyltransferase